MLFDCGIHPGQTGLAALPYLDEVDLATVDLCLITHFHLDHAAGLPYLLARTNFAHGRGRVFMTHPTKAIYRWMLSDYVRVSNLAMEDMLYDEETLEQDAAHRGAGHAARRAPATRSIHAAAAT